MSLVSIVPSWFQSARGSPRAQAPSMINTSTVFARPSAFRSAAQATISNTYAPPES